MPRYWTTKSSLVCSRRIRGENRGITVIIGLLIVSLILVLGLSYYIQINSLTAKGYQIRSFEKKIAELRAANQNLRIKTAKMQSMYSLKESIENLDMVEVAGASFLTGGGSVVAK